MRDYVGTLIETYILQKGLEKLPPELWDPDNGILNLFNAHIPFEYLSLMYASEDPGEIFSENTEYIRLVVYAGFMAVIYKVLWQIRITDDCFRDAGQTTIFDGRE